MPSKEELQSDFYKAQLIAPIDTDDVKTFIEQLKKRKAPGKTGITNKMLQKLPGSYIKQLVKMLNAALSNEHLNELFYVATGQFL